MSSPQGGTVLGGKYRLERPLASGGMGSVWIGRHVDLEVDVAIKLISWVQALKPATVERFKREARAAAQIRSPHVVQILDYGVHDGVPYIAMELLDGEDLSTHLERVRTVSPARTAQILSPVCKALGLAHGANIIHRDIKPANVFLAKSGDDEVVKVVDFGIAKEVQTKAQATSGTGLVGSPLYMSPEQIRSEPLDLRSDLWSVGIVAYELLTGTAPFDAENIVELFSAITTRPVRLPSAVSPRLAPFDAFFSRALDKKKDARFASARELMQAFEAAVKSSEKVATMAPITPTALHVPSDSAITVPAAGAQIADEATEEASQPLATARTMSVDDTRSAAPTPTSDVVQGVSVAAQSVALAPQTSAVVPSRAKPPSSHTATLEPTSSTRAPTPSASQTLASPVAPKRRLGAVVWSAGALCVAGVIGLGYVALQSDASRETDATANARPAPSHTSSVTSDTSERGPTPTVEPQLTSASTAAATSPAAIESSVATASAPPKTATSARPGGLVKKTTSALPVGVPPLPGTGTKTSQDPEWGVSVSKPAP